MKFDWATFGFQLVNVLVLLAILRRYLFRPVADIIARRQAETTEALDAARTARERADEAGAAAKLEAAKSAAVREDALAAARADAGALGAKLREQARAEAARILADARDEAARVVKSAEDETLARARDLAGAIVQRIILARPDPPTPAGYAPRLATALAAMPDDRRAALLAGGDPRRSAPRALTAAEADSIRATLRSAGVDGAVFEADASLIEGLEFRSGAGVVRNSVAHDLESIAEALKDDERSRS